MRGGRSWRRRSRLGGGLCRGCCRGSGFCRVGYRSSRLCRSCGFYRGGLSRGSGLCRSSRLAAGLLSYGSLGFFVVGHYCSFVGFLTVCHR
ncbi:hypothetical protein GCM10023346_32280 [Arthrobacter gyeryongensis]|uniref:Uncharacterized protein n=1 Tax=Arthrobacter gyeryongensis TaxID=1650592 RepID=A0ABP9SMU4_9MICC